MNFTFTTENLPKRWGWTTVERDTSSRLPDQKKGKDKTGKLLLHPGRHVHERSHVPDPGESQSINEEGLAAKSEGARTPRRENMVHGVYPGAPVVLLKIAMTDENTQNLQFGR